VILPVLTSFAAAIAPIAAALLSAPLDADPNAPEAVRNFPVRQPVLWR
jgi:hypothetical protein